MWSDIRPRLIMNHAQNYPQKHDGRLRVELLRSCFQIKDVFNVLSICKQSVTVSLTLTVYYYSTKCRGLHDTVHLIIIQLAGRIVVVPRSPRA